MNGGIAVVKIELPLDLYGKLARSTNGEVGRLLRTLATRAARMESEDIKSIARPTTETPDDHENQLAAQRRERARHCIEFITTELAKGRRVLDIANDLGISETRVYQYMRREGLKSTARKEQIVRTETERYAAIRELWLRHYSAADIVRALQVSRSYVYRIVAELKREDQIS